ncbi:hypothetical protein C8R45DRAFT_1222807 [Mycena sanguinolenta]|nr:hypothetical protein C8R45DRAFT_1222807 [Mycena sanguinolenta]
MPTLPSRWPHGFSIISIDETLFIKRMPGRAHGFIHSTFMSAFINQIESIHPENEVLSFGSRTYNLTHEKGEIRADASCAALIATGPTLVIECAHPESYPHFMRKVIKWFENFSTLKLVIVMKISKDALLFEQWERDPAGGPPRKRAEVTYDLNGLTSPAPVPALHVPTRDFYADKDIPTTLPQDHQLVLSSDWMRRKLGFLRAIV